MKASGRNRPCPCGSGKKRKLCCLTEQEAFEAARRKAKWSGPTWYVEDDPLDEDSNRVIRLIEAGRLAEAEEAALELERRYPDMIDGLDRRAAVYEAKGDRKRAAEYYRKALDFAEKGEGFCELRIRGLREAAEEQERLDREGK